ncbi:transketolase-like TK C-terminal-containing protein, partial [Variovorax sp. GB1R11]|uniref:transketolase-like TK C-terminal-containing protein n=1 Tax=Variovorax sp. GB1R11 TaxID=3443741 RepID=UPI003F48BF0B
VAATIPNCKAYDPAYAGEMAVIVDAGIREMMVEQKDVFYYVTLMNENYAQPDVPEGAEGDILRGCYRFGTYAPAKGKAKQKVTLMGSGAILTEVVKAAQLLADDGIEAEVFSVTSWSELARDGQACEQRALTGEKDAGTPFVTQQLGKGSKAPIVAATDYVRALPESVRAFLPEGRRYLTLGTDGFGRSDTRAALRDFFGVDAASIARAARHALG